MALVSRESYRTIAEGYGLSETALKRHAAVHIPELLVKARDAIEVAEASELLADVMRIRESAFALLDQAEQSHEWRARLGAIRECRENIRILAEMQGRLATQGTTIINNPEYVEVRTLIVQALESYPDARRAVVKALGSGASGNGRG